MNKSGSSLLEMLVALMLLSLIGVGLAGAFSHGLQLLRHDKKTGILPPLALRAQMRDLISTASDSTFISRYNSAFIGEPDSFSFTTSDGLDFAHDYLALHVEVFFHNDTLRLLLEGIDGEGHAFPFEEYSIEGLPSLEFRYFSNGEWGDSWENEDQLPSLVSISPARGASLVWPDFTVHLIFSQ